MLSTVVVLSNYHRQPGTIVYLSDVSFYKQPIYLVSHKSFEVKEAFNEKTKSVNPINFYRQSKSLQERKK